MSRATRTAFQGVIAGIIGATAVAVWFLIVDAIAGRILLTPAALGSALFLGADTPADIQMGVLTVSGYTVVHYGLFILFGLVASGLAEKAEDSPPLLLGLVLLFVTFEVLFIGLVAIVANWLLGTLAWWAIAAGNLIAAGAMGLYLWRVHPALHGRLSEPLENPA